MTIELLQRNTPKFLGDIVSQIIVPFEIMISHEQGSETFTIQNYV